MLWVIITIAALLAFAHVGLRAAALVDSAAEHEPEPIDPEAPILEEFWFKPDRLRFRGREWRREGYGWYRAEDGVKVDVAAFCSSFDKDLRDACEAIAIGHEQRQNAKRLARFRS